MKKLDTDQVGRVSEIRIFPLQFARADAISTILNTALNTKPIALTDQSPNTASLLQFITPHHDGKELVASALKEGVLITPDIRMNSLVVSAPVDYMNLLEQIITRLDSSSPQQAKIKVFTLVNADARLMAELLMTLFRLQPSGAPINAQQRAMQYTLVQGQARCPTTPSPTRSMTRARKRVASATLGTDEQNVLARHRGRTHQQPARRRHRALCQPRLRDHPDPRFQRGPGTPVRRLSAQKHPGH